MPGPVISFCHKVLCFLARTAICFFGSLVIVVAYYEAMQRGHSNKRLELYLSHGCVFANASLHCYSAFELWELSDFLPASTVF